MKCCNVRSYVSVGYSNEAIHIFAKDPGWLYKSVGNMWLDDFAIRK